MDVTVGTAPFTPNWGVVVHTDNELHRAPLTEYIILPVDPDFFSPSLQNKVTEIELAS